MNNFKNLLIATLTGLLALSLFTQPALGNHSDSRTSSTARAIQYDYCLKIFLENYFDANNPKDFPKGYLESAIKYCFHFMP